MVIIFLPDDPEAFGPNPTAAASDSFYDSVSAITLKVFFEKPSGIGAPSRLSFNTGE